MQGSRNASYLASAASAKIRHRLLGQLVELPGLGVALDLLIETRFLERFKPRTEPRQVAGLEFGHSFLEVVDSRHGMDCSMNARIAKAMLHFNEPYAMKCNLIADIVI
jgi:hypothetical protein